MKRIDVTKLAPITADILRSWTAPSWRTDAFDPEFDGDTAPAKPVHRRPNLVLHEAFFEDSSELQGYHDLDNWA